MKKPFKKFFIEISGACNLSCPFCPAHTQSAKAFMELGLLKKILEQSQDQVERYTLHILGEPLLHPQFKELVELLDENKAPFEFTTNALLLENSLPLLEKTESLKQINISLHSLSSNLGLEKSLSLIEGLLPKLEKLLDAREKLFINLRFWRQEKDDETLLQCLLNHYQVSPLSEKKNLRLRPRLLIHFERAFDWPSLSSPLLSTQGHCHGLSSQLGVLSDGTVVPCCLDYKGEMALGNLKQKSLQEILESPKAKAIVEGFRKGELVEELCRRCPYIERFK